MVSSVTKNITTGKVQTITVVEDLGALPLDWRATPAEFGYDDNGPGSTTKTTTYAIDPSVAAEVINGGGALLTTGSILICRKRTSDKSTWTKEAQDAYLQQRKFGPQPLSISINPETEEVQADSTVQFTAEILPSGAPQDFLWSVENNDEDITIDENGLVTIGAGVADGDYNVIVKSQMNQTIIAKAVITVAT